MDKNNNMFIVYSLCFLLNMIYRYNRIEWIQNSIAATLYQSHPQVMSAQQKQQAINSISQPQTLPNSNIPNDSSDQDAYFDCILCNKKIKRQRMHIHLKKHPKIKRKPKITDGDKKNKNKKDRFWGWNYSCGRGVKPKVNNILSSTSKSQDAQVKQKHNKQHKQTDKIKKNKKIVKPTKRISLFKQEKGIINRLRIRNNNVNYIINQNKRGKYKKRNDDVPHPQKQQSQEMKQITKQNKLTDISKNDETKNNKQIQIISQVTLNKSDIVHNINNSQQPIVLQQNDKYRSNIQQKYHRQQYQQQQDNNIFQYMQKIDNNLYEQLANKLKDNKIYTQLLQQQLLNIRRQQKQNNNIIGQQKQYIKKLQYSIGKMKKEIAQERGAVYLAKLQHQINNHNHNHNQYNHNGNNYEQDNCEEYENNNNNNKQYNYKMVKLQYSHPIGTKSPINNMQTHRLKQQYNQSHKDDKNIQQQQEQYQQKFQQQYRQHRQKYQQQSVYSLRNFDNRIHINNQYNQVQVSVLQQQQQQQYSGELKEKNNQLMRQSQQIREINNVNIDNNISQHVNINISNDKDKGKYIDKDNYKDIDVQRLSKSKQMNINNTMNDNIFRTWQTYRSSNINISNNNTNKNNDNDDNANINANVNNKNRINNNMDLIQYIMNINKSPSKSTNKSAKNNINTHNMI